MRSKIDKRRLPRVLDAGAYLPTPEDIERETAILREQKRKQGGVAGNKQSGIRQYVLRKKGLGSKEYEPE